MTKKEVLDLLAQKLLAEAHRQADIGSYGKPPPTEARVAREIDALLDEIIRAAAHPPLGDLD